MFEGTVGTGDVMFVCGEYGGGLVNVPSWYGLDAVEPMMLVCESGDIDADDVCPMMGFKRSETSLLLILNLSIWSDAPSSASSYE